MADFPPKRTKIVATIGPASDSEEQLEKMIRAGMNVARFNTKHSSPEWHHERIARVKMVAQKIGVPIATLLDLQGPEIRINLPYAPSFPIHTNETVVFTSQKKDTDDKRTILIPLEVCEALSVGNSIMIDDGIGEFMITQKEETVLTATALSDFEVKDRKTLNTPGVDINVASLIDKDYDQLDACKDEYVDYVGLSFVRNVADIEFLRNELTKRKLTAKIIAKIENQASIDNLDLIMLASDAVMVARGDLAVEVPFEELAHWQKVIILKAREYNKPVITATQMLKSMVENPRPTRAEVSDVANAVYDGTDAIMLSEETTIGAYPVKCVETQAKIALYNEQFVQPPIISPIDDDAEAVIVHAAYRLLQDHEKEPSNKTLKIDKVVCVSETGRTATLFARFRSKTPLYALTQNQRTFHTLGMSHGITPVLTTIIPEDLEKLTSFVPFLKRIGVIKSGERVMIINGQTLGQPGHTNQLSIITVE